MVDFSSEKYSGSTGHKELLVPVEKFTVRMPSLTIGNLSHVVRLKKVVRNFSLEFQKISQSITNI